MVGTIGSILRVVGTGLVRTSPQEASLVVSPVRKLYNDGELSVLVHVSDTAKDGTTNVAGEV